MIQLAQGRLATVGGRRSPGGRPPRRDQVAVTVLMIPLAWANAIMATAVVASVPAAVLLVLAQRSVARSPARMRPPLRLR